MSGNDHSHASGHDEPHELSNPFLWTAGLLVAIGALAFVFFHFKGLGKQEVRGEPRWAVAAVGAGEPDHQALIDDRSQAVLDRGEALYAKNCVSCHGPNGDTHQPGANPVPRNFHKDAFKNPLGAGPYGFYSVLTVGYQTMPAFRNLTPEERYAVVHFVSETWMKKGNPAYAAKDDAKVVAQIPAKGSGGGAGEAEVDPSRVKPPASAWPLMAAVARQDEAERARLAAWVAEAERGAAGDLAPAFARIRGVYLADQTGRLARLYAAAHGQDRAAFNATLVDEDGAGSADLFFSLLPADTVGRLYARLAETATRTN